MDDRTRIRLSKFLSLHLRHRPERLGLVLAQGGWVEVEALLAAARAAGVVLDRQALDEVVERDEKQRYSIDPGGARIRANQGHSVPVDLGLAPVEPPAVLYHGTAEKHLASIVRQGLLKRGRHHVHLSAEVETARRVGARHGRPVVLTIDAAGLSGAAALFYRAENGVWLVDHVPPRFLAVRA